MKRLVIAALVAGSWCLYAQAPAGGRAFEVATVKPVDPQSKASRYIVMQGNNRFVAKYYTLKLLIAAAYEVSPVVISGGPAWIESDHYDIVALTPGEARPPRDEQMAMLQALLADRFKLRFHREERTFSLYELDVARSGAKLKQSTAPAGICSAYQHRLSSADPFTGVKRQHG